MKEPYAKWYWKDHFAEPSLRSCKHFLAAAGLWAYLQDLMGMNDGHKGFLETAGKPLTDPAQIARMIGADPEEVRQLLGELEEAKVLSRDNRGCMYCRRIAADARLSAIRREVGLKGAKASTENQLPDLPRQKPEQTPRQTQSNSLTETPSSSLPGQTVISDFCVLSSDNLSSSNPVPVSKGESEGERQAQAIYEAYPRHVAKPKALEAITKALRAVPFADLLAKTRAYAEAVRRAGTDMQYVPYPATWFNQARYNDPLPTAPEQSTPAGSKEKVWTDEEILRYAQS